MWGMEGWWVGLCAGLGGMVWSVGWVVWQVSVIGRAR